MINKKYQLRPEVPGQLGPKTIMKNRQSSPSVEYLHFIFDGWLGDDLVECFPVYLISNALADNIKKTNLTGFMIKEAEIGYSDLFKQLYPNRKMPTFFWLCIIGNPVDDFWINSNKYLVVSQRALEFLHKFKIKNTEIIGI